MRHMSLSFSGILVLGMFYVSMYYNVMHQICRGVEPEKQRMRPPANFVKMFAHLHKQTRNYTPFDFRLGSHFSKLLSL